MENNMRFELITIETKELVGVTSITDLETPDMGLWGNFYKGFYNNVQNKRNEKVYEVYSGFGLESSIGRVTIGCELCKQEELPLHAITKVIPAGKYAKFTIKGNVYEVVPQFWKQLQQTELSIERSYICDFEEYPTSETEDVTLFIYLSVY